MPPLEVVWTDALQDLEEAAAQWPARAAEVYRTVESMAALGWSLGHPTDEPGLLYWAVPPFGVLYRVRGRRLYVRQIIDTRTVGEPFW